MHDARQHQRIGFRLPVDLYCGEDDTRRVCFTRDIGLGGLFADGLRCLAPGDPVHIAISPGEHGRLDLDSKVTRVNDEGAALKFIDNSPASMEVLQALLTPDWSGGHLLDGVLRIAPWYRDSDLAGWMRLTSIVSDWNRPTR